MSVRLEYEPETAVDDARDTFGVLSRQIDKTLAEFKDFIEMSGPETGAWRGDIPGGQNTRPVRR